MKSKRLKRIIRVVAIILFIILIFYYIIKWMYSPLIYHKSYFSDDNIEIIKKEFGLNSIENIQLESIRYFEARDTTIQLWINSIEDDTIFISQNLELSEHNFMEVKMLPYGKKQTHNQRLFYQTNDNMVDPNNKNLELISGLRCFINKEDTGYHVIEIYKEPNQIFYSATICKYDRVDFENIYKLFRLTPNLTVWNLKFWFPQWLIISVLILLFIVVSSKLYYGCRRGDSIQ